MLELDGYGCCWYQVLRATSAQVMTFFHLRVSADSVGPGGLVDELALVGGFGSSDSRITNDGIVSKLFGGCQIILQTK